MSTIISFFDHDNVYKVLQDEEGTKDLKIRTIQRHNLFNREKTQTMHTNSEKR